MAACGGKETMRLRGTVRILAASEATELAAEAATVQAMIKALVERLKSTVRNMTEKAKQVEMDVQVGELMGVLCESAAEET